MKVSILFAEADHSATAADILGSFTDDDKITTAADGHSVAMSADIEDDKVPDLRSSIAAVNCQIDEHSDTFTLDMAA